jgi:hypothetical protein
MDPLVYFPEDIRGIIFAFVHQHTLVACMRVSKKMGAAALAEAHRRAPYDIRTSKGTSQLAKDGNLLLLLRTRSSVCFQDAFECGDPEVIRLASLGDLYDWDISAAVQIACKHANYALVPPLETYSRIVGTRSYIFEQIMNCARKGLQTGDYSSLFAATACMHGDVEGMKKWILKNDISMCALARMSLCDSTGASLAYLANVNAADVLDCSSTISCYGSETHVQLLLDIIQPFYYIYALRPACKVGRIEFVSNMLKRYTVSAHVMDKCIEAASKRGHIDIVRLLVAHPHVPIYDSYVLSVICTDTRLRNHIPIVQLFLEADATMWFVRAELYEELTRDTWPELSAVFRHAQKITP